MTAPAPYALLDGTRAEHAREIVADIARALAILDPVAVVDPSLCRGAAGISLFLAEAFLATGEASYGVAAERYLDAATEAAAGAALSSSLFSGTVGVGWLLAHLDGRLLDASGAVDDVDVLVDRVLGHERHVLDLTDGLVGIGVYLLARPPDVARRGLERVVRHLDRLADRHGDGAMWPTGPALLGPDERALFPAGYLSLGMAHGQAGLVAFLARAYATGIDGTGPLLAAATAGLVSYARPGNDASGRYPTVVAPDRPTRPGSRVAWCYGDPGVAVALLAAGRALGSAEVTAEALATARAAAARPREGSQNVDAGLCHGSAGLVHVFGRLASATGDETYGDAALRWYDALLEQRAPGEPVAGFRAILRTEDGLVPAAGFLEGAAGVGLALLTATGASASAWDALLLTDVAAG